MSTARSGPGQNDRAGSCRRPLDSPEVHMANGQRCRVKRSAVMAHTGNCRLGLGSHAWSKSPRRAAGDSTTTPCQVPPRSTLPRLLREKKSIRQMTKARGRKDKSCIQSSPYLETLIPLWWALTDCYLVYGIAAVWHKHLEWLCGVTLKWEAQQRWR